MILLPATSRPKGGPARGAGPILNGLLADEYANRLATGEFAHSATGADCEGFRRMLVAQGRGIDARLNLLAWQIGVTGVRARIDVVGPASRSTARPGVNGSQDEMISSLITLRETMIQRLQSAIGAGFIPPDLSGASELLADLLSCHERDLWMLCALRWDRRAADAGTRPSR